MTNTYLPTPIGDHYYEPDPSLLGVLAPRQTLRVLPLNTHRFLYHDSRRLVLVRFDDDNFPESFVSKN